MSQPWYEFPIIQGYRPPSNPAHTGIDIGCPLGTELTSLTDGTIVSDGMEPWKGQVNVLSTWPNLGDIVVSYLHLREIDVFAGEQVKQGQRIGLSDEPPPAYSLGGHPVPHCHFECNLGTQPPYMGVYGSPRPIDPTFLLDYALDYAKAGNHMGVPQGWRDDDTTLVAPNGYKVDLGFRQFILNNPWSADDVPVSLDYHCDHIYEIDPSSPGGDRQDFMRSSLIYTAANGVQLARVGQDYSTLQARLVAANTQIALLETQLNTTADPGYVEYKAAIAALAAALKVAP